MPEPRKIRLRNTLTRKKETFKPMDPAHIKMYVCGPTVYSYAHIGNARSAVSFDMLFRVLRHTYPNVEYVRNFTDVDDKINKAAQEQNVDISVITQKYEKIFLADMDAIGCLRPTRMPRVTEHMDAIIEYIGQLIKSGKAYYKNDHVLFDTAKDPNYGCLSKLPKDDLIAGARVEVAPYKKNPSDFVLWKPSDAKTVGWESPWGRGRPGWHIECTVMIFKILGEKIDIHGGGIDLCFPHHENEIAQGTKANYWIHNGMVNMGSEKMSKSLGNIITVHDLVKQWDGEVIRYALLTAQYNQPLMWTDELLQTSKTILDKLYRLKSDTVEPCDDFIEVMNDNLNTPLALSVLARHIKDKNAAKMTWCAQFLGLLQKNTQDWFTATDDLDISVTEIEQKIQARVQAKKDKNYALSDQIRDELLNQGIILEDSASGTTWRKK